MVQRGLHRTNKQHLCTNHHSQCDGFNNENTKQSVQLRRRQKSKINVHNTVSNTVFTISFILLCMVGNPSNVIASGNPIGLPDPKTFVLKVEVLAFKMVKEYFSALISILGVTNAVKAIWGGK